MNPLGLAKNVIPFDIDPLEDATHFEQIYARALRVLNNTKGVFEYANESTSRLRENQDELQDFENNIEDVEADYNSRLR